jgi:hypothetical protein
MAQASQVATLPEFSGAKVTRADVEQFFDHVERAKRTYTWTDAQTSGAVQSRLRGYAAEIIRARTLAGVDLTTWPLLKGLLQDSFARVSNTSRAAKAVSNLTQQPDEPIMAFYARVTLALDALAYNKTAAQKAEQEYLDHLAEQEFIFVQGGMRDSHKIKFNAVPTPPATIADLIKFVQRIENAEEANAALTVAAIQPPPVPADQSPSSNQPQCPLHTLFLNLSLLLMRN